MDNNQNENIELGNEWVNCRASDLLRLMKTPSDRVNIAKELNLYFPYKEKGFDSTFLLQVISGVKKCLPLGWSNGFNLKYFKKGEKLTKEYIIQKMIGNPKYGDYVPDRIKPNMLTRDFLLSLILYLDPTLYQQLQSIEKNQMSQLNYSKWSGYQVKIEQGIYQKIQHFKPIECPKGKYKPFRITKKGIDTGVFEKIPIAVDDQGNNNINMNDNNNIQNNQNERPNMIRINFEGSNSNENNQLDMDNI